jgi:RimJ/RimL family protein N-acetyltransferase
MIDKRDVTSPISMTVRIVSLSEDNLGGVLDILSKDALSNITLIADCTQLREWCDIRVLTRGKQIDAVFSLYSDLDFLATAFWSRDITSLRTIMNTYGQSLAGKKFVAICTQGQLADFGNTCTILEPIKERQMVADRLTLLHCECRQTPVRLSMNDAEGLKNLYKLTGTPAWTPNAMNLGPFYGIIEENGTITAAAGVHYMTRFGTEIGNVATHPSHVRQGYAAACIKAVVNEVLNDSDLSILHYFANNMPAQRLYENMGFRYSKTDPVFFVKATCTG